MEAIGDFFGKLGGSLVLIAVLTIGFISYALFGFIKRIGAGKQHVAGSGEFSGEENECYSEEDEEYCSEEGPYCSETDLGEPPEYYEKSGYDYDFIEKLNLCPSASFFVARQKYKSFKLYDPLDFSVITDPVGIRIRHPIRDMETIFVNRANAELFNEHGIKHFKFQTNDEEDLLSKYDNKLIMYKSEEGNDTFSLHAFYYIYLTNDDTLISQSPVPYWERNDEYYASLNLKYKRYTDDYFTREINRNEYEEKNVATECFYD